MLSESLITGAEEMSHILRHRGQRITTVESCTGGLVGASITALPGSSDIYPGGFITYSNELKHALVGVSPDTLEAHGAVSAQTAIEMAFGGRSSAHAQFAIAITGIAGPNGGTDDKPVGTVWICTAGPDDSFDCRRFVFPGNRDEIREQSAISSVRMVIQKLNSEPQTLGHEHERIEG